MEGKIERYMTDKDFKRIRLECPWRVYNVREQRTFCGGIGNLPCTKDTCAPLYFKLLGERQ